MRRPIDEVSTLTRGHMELTLARVVTRVVGSVK